MSKGRRARRPRLFAAGFFITAAFLLTASAADSRTIHVRTLGGRQIQVESRIVAGMECLACPHVAHILGGQFAYEGGVRKGRCTVGGHEFVIVSGNPFVAVDGAARQVGIAPLATGGILWLPVSILSGVFAEPLGLSFEWKRSSGWLEIRRAVAAVEGIRLREVVQGRETVVTIGTSTPVLPQTRREGRRLLLFFPGTRLVGGRATRESPYGLVDRIDSSEREGWAVIALTLSQRAGTVRVSRRREPCEVLVTVAASATEGRERRAVASAQQAPAGRSSAAGSPPEVPQAGAGLREERAPASGGAAVSAPQASEPAVRVLTTPREEWTIVIDPGHGGKDPGAVGPTGLYEKDVNLKIANLVAERLRNRAAVRVVLTRDDDTFMPLGERTQMANRAGAQVFISLHCNAARSRKAHGAETYFLSVANTDEERAVAARENAALLLEDPAGATADLDDLSFILLDLAQNEFLEESSELAELIQAELGGQPKCYDRGIHQAGFYVLNGAYMPAVLIETGFISNREEERLLRSERYCAEMADAICAGVEEFVRRYERKLNG